MRQDACVFCKDHPISKRHRIDLAAVDAETAYFVADAMEGLAAGARVQLLCLLAQGPRSVKDLTAETGMEQPAVSQHLRVLRDLGFVHAEKKGRHKIYELYDSHVAGLLEQVIAHAQHLRDHLSTREDSTVPLSRDRKGLQRAS
jgi:ArsR family transcriptional regulator, nickel/cobalt-responsive transcriptional repressor